MENERLARVETKLDFVISALVGDEQNEGLVKTVRDHEIEIKSTKRMIGVFGTLISAAVGFCGYIFGKH